MLWEEIAQNSIIGKVCLQYSLSDITHISLLQSQNIQSWNSNDFCNNSAHV